MNQSESLKELATALSKAQAKMKMADKSSINPHFKSKYADLAEVWEACREALTSEGLSIVQLVEAGEVGHLLKTMLFHSSGEHISSHTPLFLPAQPTMQHLGAAVTYAKRISLMAMVGISVGEVDDDGEENRRDVEAAPDDKRARLQRFNEMQKKLRAVLKEAQLPDAKFLEFAATESKRLNLDGNSFMEAALENTPGFLEAFREFINKMENK